MKRKQKKFFFQNVSTEKKNNYNDFWSFCEPHFSNRSTIWKENISLTENNNLVKDDRGIAHIFSEHFKNITQSLPRLSKIIQNELSKHFEILLSKKLCGLREKFSTQHAIFQSYKQSSDLVR